MQLPEAGRFATRQTRSVAIVASLSRARGHCRDRHERDPKRWIDAWCNPLKFGFLVLQAFLRAITRYYTVQAALAGIEGPVHTGAITVIQRFSSDLRLNLHYHVLCADGVWTEEDGEATFHPAPPLGELDVQEVLLDAQLRIDRQLKKYGWQDRSDNPFADREPNADRLSEIRSRILHLREPCDLPVVKANCLG